MIFVSANVEVKMRKPKQFVSKLLAFLVWNRLCIGSLEAVVVLGTNNGNVIYSNLWLLKYGKGCHGLSLRVQLWGRFQGFTVTCRLKN